MEGFTDHHRLIGRVIEILGIGWDGTVNDRFTGVRVQYRPMIRTALRVIERERFLKLYIPSQAIATEYPEAVDALVQVQHEELDRLRDEALIAEVTPLHLLNGIDSTTYPASMWKAKANAVIARYAYPTE